MTALWIILAIALVLTLLNLLPVGVDAAYADDVFSLAGRIGRLPGVGAKTAYSKPFPPAGD